MIKIINLKNGENLMKVNDKNSIAFDMGEKRSFFIAPNKDFGKVELDKLEKAGLALTSNGRLKLFNGSEDEYVIFTYAGEKVCNLFVDYRKLSVLLYRLSLDRKSLVVVCKVKNLTGGDFVSVYTEDKKKLSVLDISNEPQIEETEINVEEMQFKSIRLKTATPPVSRIKILISGKDIEESNKRFYKCILKGIDEADIKNRGNVNFYVIKDEFNNEEINKIKNAIDKEKGGRLYIIESFEKKVFKRVSLTK